MYFIQWNTHIPHNGTHISFTARHVACTIDLTCIMHSEFILQQTTHVSYNTCCLCNRTRVSYTMDLSYATDHTCILQHHTCCLSNRTHVSYTMDLQHMYFMKPTILSNRAYPTYCCIQCAFFVLCTSVFNCVQFI